MENEKQTAKEILEEALHVKAETVQMFKEIKQQSADNLELLSRCEALIRNSVDVTPKERQGTMLEQAEELAADSEQLAEDIRNRDCHDVILGITQLAMMNKDVIHILVGYQGHTDEVGVRVHPVDQDYSGEHSPLYRTQVYLDRNRFEDKATPLQQLLELEDKLLELIAEAKDNAEVAA